MTLQRGQHTAFTSQASQRRAGVVLFFSVGTVLVLGALGATLLMQSLQESSLARRSAAQQGAFFLAETGVDQALINLRTPTDAFDDVLTGTLSTGTFTVDSPPEALGSQRWKVTTRGFSVTEQRWMEAVVQSAPKSVFEFAVFGENRVSVSGSVITDSYDSRLGLYDPSAHQHQGNVGTGATSVGGMSVSGSIFVDGQLAVGYNVQDPQSVVTGFDPAFVTGGTSPPTDTQDVVSLAQPFPIPAVIVPEGMTCADFTVTGNTTVTLTLGTYCYDDLTLQGGGTLTASDAVTIYLTGTFTASGNSSFGVVQDPRKMVMLMTSSAGATLGQGTLTGSTDFYGALYGPNARIDIRGNAKIFGSVIAEEVMVSGSAELHYDHALTDLTEVSNGNRTTLVSSRELVP